MHFFTYKTLKTAAVVTALSTASILLMGCKQETAPLATSQQPAEATASDEAHSPVLGAQTTDQAVINEGAQLNSLHQDSTATDQSFSDQPITVN